MPLVKKKKTSGNLLGWDRVARTSRRAEIVLSRGKYMHEIIVK